MTAVAMMMLYRIDWGSYDEGSTEILMGPIMSEEDWNELLKVEIRRACNGLLACNSGYIGWHEIIDAVLRGLKESDFSVPRSMHHVRVGGLPIFNRRRSTPSMHKYIDDSLLELIFQHNEILNGKH